MWEPLTDTEKKHLAAWLGQINEYTVPDCNWHFFRILVCLALKRVQMPYSPELLEDSLTYRFAQNCFWSACIWAGLEPLPLPVMKGIIVRNFRWWLSQNIFDRDGILTIGYCYPQMYMAENYNAPGSPYWSMKSFLLLALPDDHPFWAAEAAPLPALDALEPMPFANMLVQRRAGRVTAYPAGVNQVPGHGQFPEKYAKFAYDTGFAVPNFAPGYDETVENHSAEAHCDTLCCKVSGTGEGVLIKCDPNTSLYFANVRLPAVKYAIAKGHTVMDTDITDIAEK